MPKTVITKEHEEFAKENYLNVPATDIDKKFGVSKGCTYRIYRKFGLAVPRGIILKFRNDKRIGKTSFTKTEDDFIRENYLTMPVKTMGEKLGRSGVGVTGRLKAMQLVIPRDIVEQRKIDSRIKKGSTPPNKGKKQTDYMSAEAIEKTKATRFQKGQKPHNTRFDGHERLSKDGYVYIRVEQGKYVLKHRLIWEKENGKIPEGMVLSFKNGDKTDVRIDNLEYISMSDNMLRNTVHNYPENLKEIIYLKNALKRQINKREKTKNG